MGDQLQNDNEQFLVELAVRDYECDLQGVVNNANYMHYLEHARHEYLRHTGLDFSELHRRGIDPIVVRAEMDYKVPLGSGDRFSVRLSVEPRGKFRVVFHQLIERADGTLVMDALIWAAVLVNGRPAPFDKALDHDDYRRLVGKQ